MILLAAIVLVAVLFIIPPLIQQHKASGGIPGTLKMRKKIHAYSFMSVFADGTLYTEYHSPFYTERWLRGSNGLSAVDLETGKLRWRFRIDTNGWSAPVVSGGAIILRTYGS